MSNIIDQLAESRIPQTTPAERIGPGHQPMQKQPAGTLEFSRHLLERINRRKLQVGAEETRKLNEALDKAEAKGAKDSLVLLNDLAFIVSVQNRRVVTALDKSKMNEGVFTNIDSAIIM